MTQPSAAVTPRQSSSRADRVPRVYTTEEAAEILRIKKSWLERQAAARRIPFIMLARSYHFTDDQLLQILRMYENAPEPAGPAPTSRQRTRPGRGHSPARSANVAPLRPRPRPGPQRRIA